MKSGSPILAYANHAVLSPGQDLRYGRVLSRMLLWCRGGAGVVRANGKGISMSSGTFLILPWKHTIRYIVDTPSYLELGGVHIVPSYPQGLPFPFQVEHHRNENDGDDHSDWDRQIPELREIIVGHLSQSATLGYLLDYAVYRFQTGTLEEQQARLLGELMLLLIITVWRLYAYAYAYGISAGINMC